MNKIKFQPSASSLFFNSLDKKIKELLSSTDLLKRARTRMWFKTAFYFSFYILAYLILFFIPHPELAGLMLSFIFLGLTGLFLAFNVSHDTCHGTYIRSRSLNYLLYHVSFNMQGTSAYLWKIRHRASHHVFPNVDGCDADIDDNPIIRLSPQHPLRKYQRYQHLYSPIVYCFYTLHWFLIKDFSYLTRKKIGNLDNSKHPVREWILFFAWKILYLFVMVVVPVLIGYSLGQVLVCFLVMHVINSICFIHFLIATHFSMETCFPKADINGFLPTDYYQHQLATSLDYSPTSKLYNWFLGGFNAHAAHHLYPKLPHTVYPEISAIIEQEARLFKAPYHKSGLFESIRSHYRYLKHMGNPG